MHIQISNNSVMKSLTYIYNAKWCVLPEAIQLLILWILLHSIIMLETCTIFGPGFTRTNTGTCSNWSWTGCPVSITLCGEVSVCESVISLQALNVQTRTTESSFMIAQFRIVSTLSSQTIAWLFLFLITRLGYWSRYFFKMTMGTDLIPWWQKWSR